MTSPRDRVIDLLRAGSLLVVVAGHWLMVAIERTGDGVSGTNILVAVPHLKPLTWALQVMPLFFLAGGFANLTSWRGTRSRGAHYAQFVHRRLARLVPPAVAFAAVTYLALAVLRSAGLPRAQVDQVGRLLVQPLWFLAVYVVVTALAPAMAAWHARAPLAPLVVLGSAAASVDLLRLGTGAAGVGSLNFVLVWLFVHQLGIWYADGRLAAVRMRTWRILAGSSFAVVLGLTGWGPYPVSMVGVPGEMSNMSPPSICMLVLALGQLAFVMLVRHRLEAWLQRPGIWSRVAVIGAVSMTVYLWHLTVMVVVAAAQWGLGCPIPDPGSPSWWLSRPLWLAVLGSVLGVVARPLATMERLSIGRRADLGRGVPYRRVS
jgi:fucose 4-O-acetylase-like acetyltransferase